MILYNNFYYKYLKSFLLNDFILLLYYAEKYVEIKNSVYTRNNLYLILKQFFKNVRRFFYTYTINKILNMFCLLVNYKSHRLQIL